MTLDEAIKHCLEKADDCSDCGKEHLQLANWLKLLKIVTFELEECNKENKALQEENEKLRDFVRACRFAGPGGLEKLRNDAVDLCNDIKS